MSFVRVSCFPCLAAGLAVALGAGCSGDDPDPVETPSPEIVRDFFALNGDSCWRYRFRQSGASLFARVDMAGPNETSIAGETVYVRSFKLESGGLPTEWFLDTEADGEVRLLRSTEGRDRESRLTRRYQSPPAPLFWALGFDFQGDLELDVGERFETETSATVCSGEDCEDGPLERHEWVVTSTDTPVSTPEGTLEAYSMNYRVTIGDQPPVTETYELVPGRGFAEMNIGGTTYQICDWRVCDAQGDCVGAPSCNELTCAP